ncbi:S41 family peptidase [Pedobacter sp. D749]|uniref:S41 family peptidase n=1 Tax=Pedobacter sp. D749 TaxID=2856523 RepID=UPI001C55AEB6|nr:S41 family peptidase [Pedobacter sp. D749]QXU41864.1 hypothetical protein KYH19_23260 [Pedobacter sp. D749]
MEKFNIPLRFIAKNASSVMVLMCCSTLFFSCKKDPSDPPVETQVEVRKEKIMSNLDSLYAYAQQIYLWNSELPAGKDFKPARFYDGGAGNEIDIYKNEIFALSRFAINPSNNKPFEYNANAAGIPKYSSLIETGSAGTVPRYNSDDNGFGLAFVGTSDGIRILYVDMNAPAWQAGLRRGQKVVSINNEKAVASTGYYSYISSALNGSNLSIVTETLENNLPVNRTIQLKKQYFVPSPVLKSAVLNVENKKIGYIAYKSFTDEENTRQFLGPVLNQFAVNGISELIVDLRYNTGGYQNTCRYLANCIAPQSADGKMMFTEYYNSQMQAGKADLLANQPILGFDNKPVYINGKIATLHDIDYSPAANRNNFEIEGNALHLEKVSFIVSSQTASASELLINVLKPYLKVQLVGVSADGSGNVSTYGKPVGFFDIKIDRYKVYLAMYQTRNANGEGDFFDGLPAGISTMDDVTVDFADIADPAVKAIVSPTTKSSGSAIKKLGTVKQVPAGGTVESPKIKKYIGLSSTGEGLIKAYSDFKLKRN